MLCRGSARIPWMKNTTAVSPDMTDRTNTIGATGDFQIADHVLVFESFKAVSPDQYSHDRHGHGREQRDEGHPDALDQAVVPPLEQA